MLELNAGRSNTDKSQGVHTFSPTVGKEGQNSRAGKCAHNTGEGAGVSGGGKAGGWIRWREPALPRVGGDVCTPWLLSVFDRPAFSSSTVSLMSE